MDQVEFHVIADRSVIRNDQPSEVDIAVDLLTAKSVEISKGAFSLNLCFVIDRSGSMAGDKLEQAKRSCLEIYNSLNETDKLTVLAFDDDVLSVVNPQTPKSEVKSRIENIAPGGSTNLSKGWYLGLLELQTYGTPKHINRLILLSDGQATDGEQKISVLEAESASARDNLSITTTTIGIGKDFQEDILAAIATASGGRFWYIGDTKIEDLIKEEFSGALSVLLERPSIQVDIPENVKITKELNSVRKREGRYQVRAIKANDQLGIALRLGIDPSKHPEGDIAISATLFDGAGIVKTTDLLLHIGSVGEYISSIQNYRVAEIVAQFLSAESGEKMMKKMDAGDASGMLEMLKSEAEFLKALRLKLGGATASTMEEHEARRLAELQREIADHQALAAVAELLQLMQGLGLTSEAKYLFGSARKMGSQSSSRKRSQQLRGGSDDFAPLEILEQAKQVAQSLMSKFPELEPELKRIQGKIDEQVEQFS
jgi:Mg-chelatase subunit ChlD